MTFVHALVALLGVRGFRRLVAARVTSQAGDGIFQVALASHVIFNPEQAADPRAIAAAFAVVLLPYSALGPFVGVLLDRWPRRRVIVVSQLLRGTGIISLVPLVGAAVPGTAFFVVVLVVFSLNRFVLAGFSAALPHVVHREDLVDANAVAPSLGSLAYLAGGVAGAALRGVGTDRLVVLAAAVAVLAGVLAAARLPFVGPTDDEPGPHLGQVVASIARGFVELLRTLPRRGWLVLTLVLVTRIAFGLVLFQALVLSRGAYAGAGDTGLLRFGVAVGASAVGFALAVVVTPWLAAKWSPIGYAAHALTLAAAATLGLGWWFTPWVTATLCALVSFASQSVKICCDALMQQHVADQLLGRAFSAYDLVYNSGLVIAAALGAAVLPLSGLLVWPSLALGAVYLVTASRLRPAWRAAARA